MTLTAPLHDRLQELTRVFLAENAKLNLSALRTEETCWNGNVLDSLPLLDHPEIVSSAKTLLDLGTGGGFPLFPLAIALPELTCTGLDSVGKKVEALKRINAVLQLKNIRTLTGRAEVLAHMREHRERYDIVTSRAVAPLNALLEYAAGFVKVGGCIVLWKSLHIDEELKASESAQRLLTCTLERSHRYVLPGDWGERQLLIFRKGQALGKQFPREVGMAKSKPL
jgi:16S rRNA (guanine527-N7)-methyltransferase